MVLKSELLAVLNIYSSGEFNGVTIFLPYFFGLPVMLPLKGSFIKCLMLRSHDRVQICSLQGYMFSTCISKIEQN